MAYRISYDRKAAVSAGNWRIDDAPESETFETEQEALKRARELIEEGDHEAVAVRDDAGEVLGGVRLHLKLGFAAE
jgi:hypothetical protein